MNIIKTKKKNYFKDVLKHWQLYALLAIPVIIVIIFNYVPMYGVIIAFKNFSARKGIMGSPWVGMKYFNQFFSSPKSMGIIWNTIAISFYTILAGIPIPILLAIMLNEMKNKAFKKTVQMVTYAPYFISTVVLVAMLVQFTDPRIGIINKFTVLLGAEPINYMANSGWFTHLYVWSGIWQSAGYSAIIYLAALSSVPSELYEAATIDGANKWRRIWSIDLPLILPTVSILLILNFGSIMNVGFEKIYLMQNPANVNISEVISTYVYKMGMVNMNMSFSTAVNLFNSVINMVLIVFVNWLSKRLSDTGLF